MVLWRIVNREEEARLDAAEGRREEGKKQEGRIIKSSRIIEKKRNRAG